jgi:hypothetical protein
VTFIHHTHPYPPPCLPEDVCVLHLCALTFVHVPTPPSVYVCYVCVYVCMCTHVCCTGYGQYPGTGQASETGVHNNVINVPLQAGAGSTDFREVRACVFTRVGFYVSCVFSTHVVHRVCVRAFLHHQHVSPPSPPSNQHTHRPTSARSSHGWTPSRLS